MTDFEEYVERYCESRQVTLEEALEHELVRIVKAYYETRD